VLLPLISGEGDSGGFVQLLTTKPHCEGAHEVGLGVPTIFAKLVELTSKSKQYNDLKLDTVSAS